MDIDRAITAAFNRRKAKLTLLSGKIAEFMATTKDKKKIKLIKNKIDDGLIDLRNKTKKK